MISFAIKNRWTGSVIFTAEIDATDETAASIKLGLAVRVAVKAKAYLRGADLRGADLSEADLRGADLRGAYLGEVPVIEDIHAKVYAAATANLDLFDMSTFATGSGHSCGTAQCRAGWVLAVAGKEGLDLEAKIGTPAAAMAIYLASDPERWNAERLPGFYCGNATALADMARMARMAGVSANPLAQPSTEGGE